MLAKRGGLDLAKAFEAIRASSGNSFVHETESQVDPVRQLRHRLHHGPRVQGPRLRAAARARLRRAAGSREPGRADLRCARARSTAAMPGRRWWSSCSRMRSAPSCARRAFPRACNRRRPPLTPGPRAPKPLERESDNQNRRGRCAAWCSLGDRQLEIREYPDPSPGPGEVVLEIKASGMCGSDLKFYRPAPGEAQRALGLGDLAEPIIAGHEPCGVVAAVGPGVPEAEARVGMRVMDHHYCGCGVCRHCKVGWSQLCGAGFVVYGVTAERRPCRLHDGAGAHAGAAAGRAVLRDRRRDLLRHRHRLQCAPPHRHCPGATRSRCSARARSGSARCSSAAPWARG